MFEAARETTVEEVAGLEGVSALVLAGGEGKRLRSVVGQRAKVLAQVGGKPFLSHLLSRLRLQGIRRVILALGCFHQDVLDYLENQTLEGLEIVPVIENGPLGTAGAILNAGSVMTTDPVIVLNGDTYAEVPLEPLLTFHRERFAAVTLAAAYKKAAQRYGSIEIGKDGRVLDFIEKGKEKSGYVNAGGLCCFPPGYTDDPCRSICILGERGSARLGWRGAVCLLRLLSFH